MLRLPENRQTRLFLRRDDGGQWLFALIHLPRDRYTARARLEMANTLRQAYGATSIDFTARVSESVLAALCFVVRVEPPDVLPDVDQVALEARLAAAARSWAEDLPRRRTHSSTRPRPSSS